MVKEVDYVVQESQLLPETTIYAGIIKVDEDGVAMWKTRGDVTQNALNSVLRHLVAKTKKQNKDGKGMKWTYSDVEGYNIEVKLTKKGGDSADSSPA